MLRRAQGCLRLIKSGRQGGYPPFSYCSANTLSQLQSGARAHSTTAQHLGVLDEALSALQGMPTVSRSSRAVMRQQSAPSPKAPALSPAQLREYASLDVDAILAKKPGSEALVFLAEVLFEGLTIPGGEAGEGGLSIAADKGKAARLWKAVGYEGDSEARYHYALCLLHGHGAPASREAAEAELDQLSRAGHAKSQYTLATLLDADPQKQGERGQRVFELLSCSIRGGVVPAIHNLGNMFADGRPPFKRDDELALKLYSMGSALGDPSSSFTLGTWYCQGRATDEDWERGFHYHQLAAQAGLPQAWYNVATHYFSGRGVDQDLRQAAKFFQLAAQAGMVQAMVNLGNMHREGLGVPPSIEEARKWLSEAAARGSSAAQDVLREMDVGQAQDGTASTASDSSNAPASASADDSRTKN